MQTLHGRRYGRLFYLAAMILVTALAVRATDAPVTTLIHDTVYRANGTPAKGTLVISWPAFETVDHRTVAAGTLTVALGDGGSLDVPLAPNQGATPLGTYYKVVAKLDDGTTTTEYWNVPSISPATVASVRTTVLVGPPQAPTQNFVQEAEVSLGPLPNKIPRADASGKLVEAWIPNSVANPLQHDAVSDVLSCPTCVTTSATETITGRKTFSQQPLGVAGGSNAHIQFNVGGVLGGDANLTWDAANGLQILKGVSVGGAPNSTVTLQVAENRSISSTTGWSSIGNYPTITLSSANNSITTGLDSESTVTGPFTAPVQGIYVYNNVTGGAIVPQLYGIHVEHPDHAGATVTKTAGIQIESQAGVGSTNYALDIADQGTGASDYAIHVAGGQSYLGGKLVVGGQSNFGGKLVGTAQVVGKEVVADYAGGIDSGGQMVLTASDDGPSQGYVMSNWGSADKYARNGASSLMIMGMEDSPTENVLAGDIAFLNAPAGTAGSPINWAGNLIIKQAGGKVGVGTFAPHYKFQVAPAGGDGIAVATTDFNHGTSAGSALKLSLGSTTGNSPGYIDAVKNGGTAPSDLFLNSAGGKVGIGISNNTVVAPATLYVASATDPSIIAGDGQGAACCTDKWMQMGYKTASGYGFLQAFQNSVGAKPLSIQPSGGNIMVGRTSDDGHLFQIAGTASLASYVDLTEIAAPANPAAGVERWYANSITHQLSCLTSSGGNCSPAGGGGVTSLTGDGSLISNSGSTGAVTLTLANAAAGTVLGNATGSSTMPVYSSRIGLTEGTAPAGITSIDFLYPDSTAHRWKMINNNGTPAQVVASGADINTSDQVTATHLAAALPVNQGGTGTISTLTGLVRGSGSAMTAAEVSGDCTTNGSNAITCTKTNNVAFAAAATTGYALFFGSATGASMAACSNGGGTTSFIGLGGATNTTESSVIRFLVPVAGTLKNFNVKLSANVPASQSAAFKISKNGSSTGTPAVTVGAGASTGVQDTSTATPVSAGDLISVAVTCSGGTTSLTGPISATVMVQ